jgi:hypothetical protein
VRVRTFELRLIGVALVACWTLTAGLVLLAYRPGGPIDVFVGLAAAGPIAIAVAAVAWPPVAHGDRAFPAMVWLGLGAILFLIPSITGIADQLRALGPQTLLPSPEAAYPWLLALLGTSMFCGFGLARRVLGQTAMRRRRLIRGVVIALGLTVVTGSLFTGAAIANELALRDRVTAASRFGPTDPLGQPPECDDPLDVGRSGRITLRLGGEIDGRSIGAIDLAGLRRERDFRWLAYAATTRNLGQFGWARIGETTWERTPDSGWLRTEPERVAAGAVDAQVAAAALNAGYRATAEDHGIEVIEGARARRCRITVDGATFGRAFPQVRWLVGEVALDQWRGQLDYWVFLDGQLGLLAGSVEGQAAGIEPEALLATVDVRMTVTERGRDLVIYPPPG